MDLNRVIIQGHLGGDPEGMAFQNGTTCSRFSIAVNGREKGSEIWVDVKAWGKQADNCNRYLQKGRAVIVEGRIAMDEWTDKNTGKRRRSMYVSADNVIFGSEQERAEAGAGAGRLSAAGRGLSRRGRERRTAAMGRLSATAAVPAPATAAAAVQPAASDVPAAASPAAASDG